MILAVDNGFYATKTSKNVVFHSTIRKGNEYINDTYQITINGVNYIVGEESGNYIIDSDKLRTERNREILKVCTLTGIGLSFPHERSIDLDLVVGCPVAYYNQQKDGLMDMMKDLSGDILIKSIGETQTIKINEVLVLPQGLGLVFKHAEEINNDTSLVIDIGGGTIDVILFKGLQVVDKATYSSGMWVLYERLAQYLNATYYTKYHASDMYEICKRGYFSVYGNQHSMDLVENIIIKHVDDIMAMIERTFGVSAIDHVYCIGGGATPLQKYFKRHIPNLKIEKDSRFANAKYFEFLGEMQLNL